MEMILQEWQLVEGRLNVNFNIVHFTSFIIHRYSYIRMYVCVYTALY